MIVHVTTPSQPLQLTRRHPARMTLGSGASLSRARTRGLAAVPSLDKQNPCRPAVSLQDFQAYEYFSDSCGGYLLAGAIKPSALKIV